MLYRFREAQAAELGLGTRGDRRPKMASACKSLRECERWRGEILREISRKVSKIQDSGLTDYEVRDINDEINKLLREKRHWENQIIALVPGTKGYKYFGRAKDLPGVRELFQSRKKEEEEETQALAYYKKFMHQGPAYFGDLDESQAGDGLLDYERESEEAEWREAHLHIREMLHLPADEPIPDVPRGARPLSDPPHVDASSGTNNAKRKASSDADTGITNAAPEPPLDNAKRSKTDSAPSDATPTPSQHSMQANAEMAALYIPFLSPKDLLPPKLPTRDEMEGVLLRLQKQALVNEYFGEA
ncbi:Isy1-like splicing family-domain-containing protein [Melanogaster broomeanus]|nr:Isy1-like splicing family-domain-containing protein [Melanogaster broomeanus]